MLSPVTGIAEPGPAEVVGSAAEVFSALWPSSWVYEAASHAQRNSELVRIKGLIFFMLESGDGVARDPAGWARVVKSEPLH